MFRQTAQIQFIVISIFREEVFQGKKTLKFNIFKQIHDASVHGFKFNSFSGPVKLYFVYFIFLQLSECSASWCQESATSWPETRIKACQRRTIDYTQMYSHCKGPCLTVERVSTKMEQATVLKVFLVVVVVIWVKYTYNQDVAFM